jgi:Family of unknown function (DUF5996)
MSTETSAGRWPPLPLAEWEATRDTLQLWTQIVGKVRTANGNTGCGWSRRRGPITATANRSVCGSRAVAGGQPSAPRVCSKPDEGGRRWQRGTRSPPFRTFLKGW